MNALYPIIRRKRHPLIEVEAAPAKPEAANKATAVAPVVPEPEKQPGGEPKGEPVTAPETAKDGDEGVAATKPETKDTSVEDRQQ